MYREVSRNESDRKWMRSHDIRYDVTSIPPANLDGEYVKTKGHYHPENQAGAGYPELYEVWEGLAHFLLQHKTLRHIVLIEAQKGDVVVIPPGYGHVTINPSADVTLTMANLVSTAFSSEYAFYEKMHGAAFYELTGGIFHKNPAYPPPPEIRKMKQLTDSNLFAGFGIQGSLYDSIRNERIIQVLNHPENFNFSKFCQ